MFTINQIIAHFIGDFLLQNHWMTANKTKRWIPAIIHSFFYTLPFIPLCTQNPFTLFIIMSTHAIEDRYYLIKHFIAWKNRIGNCQKIGLLKFNDIDEDTGAVEGTPDWIAKPMLWIQDNVLHLLINGLAIYFIG